MIFKCSKSHGREYIGDCQLLCRVIYNWITIALSELQKRKIIGALTSIHGFFFLPSLKPCLILLPRILHSPQNEEHLVGISNMGSV